MLIGIDLGGTKIEAVLISAEGEELHRERVATPCNDYDGIIQALVDLVGTIENKTDQLCSIGVGTPGSLSQRDGTMKNCNSTCLNGRLLQQDLERKLGRSIRLANDANCFSLSEAVDGAAKKLPVVFGVIVGTGVGGGLVINQQALIGPNAIGSEWGHNSLPGIGIEFENEQRSCYCGRQNCIETYLSGPGFAKTYHRLSAKNKTAEEVAQRAQAGEAKALQALQIYQQQLAYALSQLINIIDPDAIVLGGGMSNIQSLYQQVPKLWSPYVFSDTVETQLLKASFGDSSGVRGAARLWSL